MLYYVQLLRHNGLKKGNNCAGIDRCQQSKCSPILNIMFITTAAYAEYVACIQTEHAAIGRKRAMAAFTAWVVTK